MVSLFALAPARRRALALAVLASALVSGVALGNVLRGLPLGPAPAHAWQGPLLELFHPYPLLVGLLCCALLVMRGALHVAARAGGALSPGLRHSALRAHLAFVALGLAVLAATWQVSPFLFARAATPACLALFAVLAAATLGVPVAARAGRPQLALAASTTTLLALAGLVALALYPGIVPSRVDLANSLTIYNAASAPALHLGLVSVALLAAPVALGLLPRAIPALLQGPPHASGAPREGPRYLA